MTGAATFSGPIARIFRRKCVPCHAPRGLAMPLLTHHDARPWARAIREEVLDRRMPPWPVAPGSHALANDIGLTAREIELIVSWTDGGTPRGDDKQLPPARPAQAWPHGQPDRLIAVPAQVVEAGAPPHVRRVTLDPDLAAPAWLRGLDFRPGDRRVVRAVFASREGRAGEGDRWLGAWTPWAATAALPDTVAHRLSPGTRLRLELHYQGAGEPVTDAGTLGLYLSEGPPASEPIDLVVRAGCTAASCEVARGEAVVPFDALAWALKPEPGAAARSLEVGVREPSQRADLLAWIEGRDAVWPMPLLLREPVALPRGTRISLVARRADAATAAPRAAVTLSLYPRRTEAARAGSAR